MLKIYNQTYSNSKIENKMKLHPFIKYRISAYLWFEMICCSLLSGNFPKPEMTPII